MCEAGLGWLGVLGVRLGAAAAVTVLPLLGQLPLLLLQSSADIGPAAGVIYHLLLVEVQVSHHGLEPLLLLQHNISIAS